MTKTTSILWMAAALTMSAAPAAAQTTKNIFVDINAGVQVASRTFVVDAFPIVYAETAILSTSQEVGAAGLFDVTAGYRVWRDLSIGLGFSYAGGSGDATMSAWVPHPLFHDRRVLYGDGVCGAGKGGSPQSTGPCRYDKWMPRLFGPSLITESGVG